MSEESQKSQAPPAELEAVVGKVRDDGKGKFVVTYPKVLVPPFNQGEEITFSLCDWKGRLEPRKGEVVLLRELRQFARGWRSLEASPLSQATSQKSEGS